MRLSTAMIRIAAASACLLLSACGFRPVYAVASENADIANGGLRSVEVADIAAADTVEPYLRRALIRRAAREGGRYLLSLNARETAVPLSVQIDASVTRYNYTLNARYTLIDQETGQRISGRARSIASFNVISSQYSTLFAENAAREKAANALIEDIERDILQRIVDRSNDDA